MKNYRLDKTAFKAQTFAEADADNLFAKEVPVGERLRQAYFLTLKAYGYSYNNEPKLDRTLFSMRKF